MIREDIEKLMKLVSDDNEGIKLFNQEMEINEIVIDSDIPQFIKYEDVRNNYDKFSQLYRNNNFSYKTLCKLFGNKNIKEISNIMNGIIEYNVDDLIKFMQLSNIKNSVKYDILSKLYQLEEEKWKGNR